MDIEDLGGREHALPAMGRPLEELPAHAEVIVVGSGYGASAAVSRLARAGRDVVLLERGLELHPGQYPNTLSTARAQMQFSTGKGHWGARTGMFHFHMSGDMNALVGCGLGGGSLINANAMVWPEPRVFEDERWPEEFRADVHEGLAAGMVRAERMLRPATYPASFPVLKKVESLRESAQAMEAPIYPVPINVNFQNKINHVGVEQPACTGCGDCVTGCNVGAKNTLIMNYLPDAHKHGARIHCGVTVDHVLPSAGDGKPGEAGWEVFYHPTPGAHEEGGSAAPSGELRVIRCDVLVLGAGALGSTGILLRSRERAKEAGRPFPLSSKLGASFSGNGDQLGFAYNGNAPVNCVGESGYEPPRRIYRDVPLEEKAIPKGQPAGSALVDSGADEAAAELGAALEKSDSGPVGPCVSHVIDLRFQDELDHGLVIEDGSIPGALAGVMPTSLSVVSHLIGERSSSSSEPGKDIFSGLAEYGFEKWKRGLREVSDIAGSATGAMMHTQTLLVMSHDGSDGAVTLDAYGEPCVKWRGVGSREQFQRISRALNEASSAIGAKYVHNPGWSAMTDHQLTTVHALGGCAMGSDSESGAVNHKGQVFRPSDGDGAEEGARDVYSSLYVVCGAVIPRSLGYNPIFTITSVAERNLSMMLQERGWVEDESLDESLWLRESETTIVDPLLTGVAHRFESASFTRPTYCDLCGQFIWGIANQGKRCVACGKVTHHRCEGQWQESCQ